MGPSFSPPKGIQVFATWRACVGQRLSCRFQSPEGDSGLCYLRPPPRETAPLLRFSPPKGIQVFATRRRLKGQPTPPPEFQSPEGDSGLCYKPKSKERRCCGDGFSPPKGIQVFATSQVEVATDEEKDRFSPPKGIQVFATSQPHSGAGRTSSFQSPEGDSGLCYLLSKNLPLTRFSSLLLSFPRLCADLPSISFLTPFSTPKSALLRMKELTLALVFSRFLSSPRFPSISAVLGYLEAPKRHFFEVSYV